MFYLRTVTCSVMLVGMEMSSISSKLLYVQVLLLSHRVGLHGWALLSAPQADISKITSSLGELIAGSVFFYVEAKASINVVLTEHEIYSICSKRSPESPELLWILPLRGFKHTLCPLPHFLQKACYNKVTEHRPPKPKSKWGMLKIIFPDKFCPVKMMVVQTEQGREESLFSCNTFKSSSIWIFIQEQ